MSLNDALTAYAQGNHAQAYRLAKTVTQAEPNNENAWVLLLTLAESDAEKAEIAKRILHLNPQNPAALQYQVKHGQRDLSKDVKVYEMLWDCEFCGSDKLLGKTHRFCPHCGAPQAADKRYFPEEEDKIAVQDHQYFGADKLCPACGTANSGQADFCQQCGSPLDGSKQVAQRDDQLRADGDAEFRSLEAFANTKKTGGKKGCSWIVLAVIALIIGGILVFAFWTKETSAVLETHQWTRSIDVERYGAQSDREWCDQMPRDAYHVDRKNEIRSYRQVPDGEKCNTRRVDQGDGTYIEKQECHTVYRKEPIYDTRCYFTVDRWAHERSIKANATDKKPYWPEVRLAQEGTCKGCERLSGRSEHYNLQFSLIDGKEKTLFSCEVPFEQWQRAQVKSRWKVEVGMLIGEARCDSLQLQ